MPVPSSHLLYPGAAGLTSQMDLLIGVQPDSGRLFLALCWMPWE